MVQSSAVFSFFPSHKPIQKLHTIIISFGQEQDQAKEKIAMFFQNRCDAGSSKARAVWEGGWRQDVGVILLLRLETGLFRSSF